MHIWLYTFEKEDVTQKNLINYAKKISKIFRIFKQQEDMVSDGCDNLTSIQGIGLKNCNNFYEAVYLTPESIISASD